MISKAQKSVGRVRGFPYKLYGMAENTDAVGSGKAKVDAALAVWKGWAKRRYGTLGLPDFVPNNAQCDGLFAEKSASCAVF